MEPKSLAASSKQAKASTSIPQIVSCLVDGCKVDLSLCRDYHRRHKVCEVHSKAPKVTIKGREQRFCQQCSRFHSLEEFDQRKRSCRKRLDCHNRRRRKLHPLTMPQNSTFFIADQPPYSGTTYISFGSTLLVPGAVKMENNHQMTFDGKPESQLKLSHSFNALNHFYESTPTHYDLKLFSEGSNHQVIVPDGVFSLLSSAPHFNKGLSSLNYRDTNEESQFLTSGFSYDPFHRDTESLIAQCHDCIGSNQHLGEMLQTGEGSSGSRKALSSLSPFC